MSKLKSKASDICEKLRVDPDCRHLCSGRLTDRVEAARSTVNKMEARWNDIDAFFYGPSPTTLTKPWPNAPEYEFQGLQEKIESLVAWVCAPILRNEPTVLVRGVMATTGKKANLESMAHHALMTSRPGVWLRELVTGIYLYGLCDVRPRYVPKKRNTPPSIAVDVVYPRHIIAYPSTAHNIDDQIVHGHRYTMPYWQFQQKMRSHEFYSDAKDPGFQSTSQRGATIPADDSIYKPESPVDMCHLLVRFVDDEDCDPDVWYRVRYCEVTQEIVSCKPFEGVEPEYIAAFTHREYRSYYNKKSRAFNLEGPQQFHQDMRHLTVWLSMLAAMPPVFVSGMSMAQQITQVGPGMIIPLGVGGSVTTPNIRTELTAFPLLLNATERDLDSAARLSSNMTGAAFQRKVTATEADIVAQGSQAGVAEDIMVIGIGVADLVKYILRELIAENLQEWTFHHGEAFGARGVTITKDDLQRLDWVELNGASPAGSPQAQFEQLAKILSIFGPAAQFVVQALVAKDPEIITNLIRSLILSTNISGKENILPEIEEHDGQQAAQGQAFMQGGLPLGVTGMEGFSGEQGMAPPQGGMGAPPRIPGREPQGHQPGGPPGGLR